MIWCGITTPKCNNYYAYPKRSEYKWKTMPCFDEGEIYYQKRLMVSINKRPTKLVIACTYFLTEKKHRVKNEWVCRVINDFQKFSVFSKEDIICPFDYMETKYSERKQTYEARNENSWFDMWTSLITLYTLFICIFYCSQYFREITNNVKPKYSLYQTFRNFWHKLSQIDILI